LESTIREAIIWLLHGEVMLGDMGLNKNQVIQSYLESRVAGAGATKRLLDKGSQREDSLAAELTAADHRGQGPDGLNNVGSRINKVVDEVDFSVSLPNQRRRAASAGPRASGTSSRVLAELGRNRYIGLGQSASSVQWL